MDSIHTISIQSLPRPSAGAGRAGAAVPVLPKPTGGPILPVPQQHVSTADIEQARQAAVEKAAREYANPFVLGQQQFTIYKDATGQYITRFRDLGSGKVTYIPEPSLLNMQKGPAQPAVSLNV